MTADRERLGSAPVGRGLRRDRRGVALTEFAIILPVLLLLYVGGAQLSELISCSRKVTSATRLTADLVSQYAAMDAREVDHVFRIAGLTMAPHAPARTIVRVTAITVDANGSSRVVWSRAQNASPFKPGAQVEVPPTIRVKGRSFVRAEMSYPFRPAGPLGFLLNTLLSDEIYMMPRLSVSVACPDCSK